MSTYIRMYRGIYIGTYTYTYTVRIPAADVLVGKDVATTLLLVVKYSRTLCVVTGLELKTVLSLAVDTTSIHSMLGDITIGVVNVVE